MVETPECDKLAAIPEEEREAIGRFLDWLSDAKDWTICEYKQYWSNGLPRYIHENPGEKPTPCPKGGSPFCTNSTCQPNPEYDWIDAGYYRVPLGPEKMMAAFYGIDLEKVEQEKRALLAEVREQNNGN